MNRRVNVLFALAASVLVVVVLWPVTGAAFLNWDDDAIFLQNPSLTGSSPWTWAFSTTHMGHFQPLSWLAWSAVARVFGVAPEPFHVLNLATHAMATALVFLLAVELLDLGGVPPARARAGALAGAALFGVHPLGVEPVAWASAFPYLAALVFALSSGLAYVRSRSGEWRRAPRRPTGRAMLLSVAAVGAYAVSLAFRPIAVGFPLVLLLLDWFPLRAAHRRAGRDRIAPLVADKTPYILLAGCAVALEWVARRDAGFNELSLAARATLVATGPFVYLWRTIAPVGLSPAGVLALEVQGSSIAILAVGGLAAITWAAWRWRSSRPALLVLWGTYLLLVAPTIGLAPTGLQATADRYAYLPGVATAMAVAVALASSAASFSAHRAAIGFAVVVCAILSVLSRQQISYWQDSVALWTRAAAVDPRNDVAYYNLGSALQASGRGAEAAAAYETTLRLVPDHAPARRNLALLRAVERQREADALAQAGNLAAAVPLYRETLTLDPRRARARAALGLALAQAGDFSAAAPELERALHEGIDEPPVINAAAYALVQTGRTTDAIALLRAALTRHPGDEGLAHNLALIDRGTKK